MRDNTTEHYGKTKHYEDLKRAASHYRGETNFCAVIAIGVVLGINFGKARKILQEKGRRTGGGTHLQPIKDALEEGGKTLTFMPHLAMGTVATLTRRLPSQGTYIALVRGHILTVVDGEIRDWTAHSGQRRRITHVYLIESSH
jgi:hypothetical protein